HTRCLSDWSSDVCSSDLRNRTSSIGRNSTPTSSKARWIALAVAGSGGRRSSSKLSTALSLTEAVLASLPTDQPSRVRAERLWARSEERRVGKAETCRGLL